VNMSIAKRRMIIVTSKKYVAVREQKRD